MTSPSDRTTKEFEVSECVTIVRAAQVFFQFRREPLARAWNECHSSVEPALGSVSLDIGVVYCHRNSRGECRMIPFDGEGRPIYPRVYRVLKAHGGLLTQCGYVEAKKKPNLFYRNAPGCVFFADMRGTEDVRIWEDTRPLHSVLFSRSLPNWQMRRIRKQELEMLYESGCACRLSFYFPRSEVEFEETGVFFDAEAGLFLWPDGFCRCCGKDFQNEGWHCSEECRRAEEFASLPACAACGVKIPREEQIYHHVSYSPEVIVKVHASCHQRIHRTEEHPELRPSREETENFYQRKRFADGQDTSDGQASLPLS